MIETGDFVPGHARQKKIVSRIVSRITRIVAHPVGETPAAQMLAGTQVGEIGGGKVDSAVALFDQKRANFAVGQLDGQRQADRTGAGDEHGNAARWIWIWPARAPP